MSKESFKSDDAVHNSVMDRRKNLRMPVDILAMEVDVRGLSSAFIYKAHIVNLSRGGVCLEWNNCRECPGYMSGEIHPDCIFSPYDNEKPGSNDLLFYITIPWTGQTIEFKGKAVYTFKEYGTEKIGIIFTEISKKALELLESIIEATKDYNKNV